MKKIITLLFVLAGILGFTFAKGTAAQTAMLVSPGVWVKGTSAVEEITIHVAYPLSALESVTLEVLEVQVLENGDEVPGALFEPIEEGNFTMSADSRGDLVIKFVPDIDLYAVDDSYFVRVTIGTEYSDSSVITVREAGIVQ